MSDERLRELERRWKETSAVEDEAAYLLERVRAGELSQNRLELAACLGHPAAEEATGQKQHPSHPILDWVEELGRWGDEVLTRTAIAAARRTLEFWELDRPHDRRPHEAIAAAERWVGSPGSETAESAAQARLAAEQANEEAGSPEDKAAWAAAMAALAPTDPRRAAREAVWEADDLVDGVCEAVVLELLPWVLGLDR